MAIDWDRLVEVASGESLTVITVSDEETVDVSAGKEILYIRNVDGGGGGGGGDVNWGDIGGVLSNQTDLQTALNAKANTADLGDLATQDTVDYTTDVTNTPTLGTMSAVNDAPSNGSEYVRKNGAWAVSSGGGGTWGSISGDLSDQTDLAEALDAKAPVIVNSASGSIASISDAIAGNAVGLTVDVEPVQSGSGDPSPSNVRPISGWTSAKVTRTGKNLFTSYSSGTGGTNNGVTFTVNTDGSISAVGTATGGNAAFAIFGQAKRSLYPNLQGKTVTLSGCPSGGSANTYYLNGFRMANSGETTAADYGNGVTFVWDTGERTDYNISIVVKSGASINDTFYPQLELGTTATSYVPYSGEQVTIDLDGTRYGGTVDVVNGTMMVTKAFATFTGANTEYWGVHGSIASWFYTDVLTDAYKSNSDANFAISNAYKQRKYYDATSLVNGEFSIGSPDGTTYLRLIVKDTRFTTVSEFTTNLASNPLQVCYELATPQTVTLTPAQLSLLQGDNVVWADCGDVSVSYKADTKGYVDNVPHHTYYVKGTQTASTGAWTGDLPEVETLFEGLTIDYYLPYAGSGNATLNLTLKGGVQTGEVNCYYGGTNRLSTQVPQYYVCHLVYQTVTISGTEYTGWYLSRSIDSNDVANMVRYYNNYIKASSVIYRTQLLFHTDEDTVTPLNNVNNSTATNKTMLTNVEFDPYGHIYYYSSTTQRNQGAVFNCSETYHQHSGVDLRFSLNCGTTLTANNLVYLKVVMQSNGKCKLASDPCWTQTLPSTADGYHYILLGRAYSTYQISLYPEHPIYYHDGVALREAYQWDAPKDGNEYVRKNGDWSVSSGGGGGGGTWGSITGTLSNQTDLQSALDAKADSVALASEFDETVTYHKGDFVTRFGRLYRFEGTHNPGPWSPYEVTETQGISYIGNMVYTKAPIDSPTFTGTPTAPTPSEGDVSTKIATTTFVDVGMSRKFLHISMPSTSTLGAISNAKIKTTMRVVNIVWGTPSNVLSDVTWNTDTAGQLVLSGTLGGATTAEIDLLDFKAYA